MRQSIPRNRDLELERKFGYIQNEEERRLMKIVYYAISKPERSLRPTAVYRLVPGENLGAVSYTVRQLLSLGDIVLTEDWKLRASRQPQ